MNKDVKIGISARHVHLTKETYDLLFDEELTVKKNLNQIGQFASNQTLTVKTKNHEFNNVRIIGPLRSYNQVEISKSDARLLGINPPVRNSGDVLLSEKVVLKTDKNEIEVEACIIANRHVHMNEELANSLGVVNNELVKLQIDGEKSGLIDVVVKVSNDGFFEVHLETDDANAFLIENGDIGKLVL